MTVSTSRRVVTVTPNGPPEKRTFPFATTWVAPVVLTLDDGSEVPMVLSPYTRKKDAVAGAAAKVNVRNMVANFRDGEFVGTTTSYGLGSHGLVEEDL